MQEINMKNVKPIFIAKDCKEISDDEKGLSFTLTLIRPKGQHKKTFKKNINELLNSDYSIGFDK